MAKLWAGRTDGTTDKLADDFNSSIHFDSRMYRQDIAGSMAHASMLGAKGIISQDEAMKLIDGLQDILDDLESGALKTDDGCEDIHMFVEQVLTERIGETGKKLHTARSRNDQVALDLRMYLRDEIDEIYTLTEDLILDVTDKAEEYKTAIMPGYTHLQRAQPISFGHQLMAYSMMLLRDLDRLSDCRGRTNVSPVGSCALAGTTYDTDRFMEAKDLGFDGVCLNSIDGVSDRDFCVELLGALSILMMHLSRFSEEIILWSSWEFKFVELSDSFTTGSSIMPQKKNPDMAELVRGKTGRVYGDLIATLTMLKGLPLAYNKDMQEDKETVFDACDTLLACIKIFEAMIKTAQWNTEALKQSAGRGFTNATDAADYLVKHGLAFRDAHHVIGEIVLYCEQHGLAIDELSLEQLRSFSPLFGEDVYAEISLETCVNNRKITGGPAQKTVEKYIRQTKQLLLSL